MLRRKIHIGNDVWRYQIGSLYLKLKDPDGKTHYVAKDRFTWEDNSNHKVKVDITSSVIKKYVETTLIAGRKWYIYKYLAGKQK